MDKKTLSAAAIAFVAGGLITYAGVRGTEQQPGAVPMQKAAASSADPAPDPAPDPADPVVAKVAGTVIYFSEAEAMKALLPDQYKSLPTAMLFPQLREQAVTGKLLALEARKRGLHENPRLRRRLAFLEDRLLQDSYLSDLTKEATKGAGEAELQKRYEAFLKDYKAEDEVHARHILLKTKEEAEAVVKEIETGADFVELAKKKSTGPSAPRGGDLGWFAHGQMVPGFSDAAFKLEKGGYTKEPVQTQFGWHVIKVVDRRAKEPPKFDEVEKTLTDAITSEYVRAAIEKLRGAATIERFNADGSEIEPEKAEKPEEKPEAKPEEKKE